MLSYINPIKSEVILLLNDKQQEVVASNNATIITLAGPGSGKTRVLTERIVWLIQDGVNPHSILAVTFTNKAAREMASRLEKRVPKGVTVSTFHSYGVKILKSLMDFFAERSHSLLLSPELKNVLPHQNVNNKFTIYNSDEQEILLKDVIKSLNLSADIYDHRVYGSFISSQKNKGILPKQCVDDEVLLPKGGLIYNFYQARLLAQNAVDFDDLILLPLVIFSYYPKTIDLFRNRYRYLFVDEFQDTNDTQYGLTVLLAKGNNLMVVGDEDQSIYGFRHANFRNVANLMKDRPDHHLVLLEQNYRSSKPIVDLANNLITQNTERVSKTLWTANETAGRVEMLPCYDEIDESFQISTTIKRAGIDWKNIAVLMRTNAQSRAIETAFIQNRIPYNLLRGTSFYERKEIMALVAYLKVIYNGDVMAFKRIANVPKRALGDVALNAIIPQLDGDVLTQLTLWYNGQLKLNIPNRYINSLKNLSKELIGFREFLMADGSVFTLIERVIGYLKPHFDKEDNPTDRYENMLELLSVVKNLMISEGEAGLAEFLEQTALVSVADGIDDENRVTIATIHAAKGLEWDMVFVAGAEIGLMPHFNCDDVEEERRLCYVALTRAKKSLYISWTSHRMLYGHTRPTGQSEFLKGL